MDGSVIQDQGLEADLIEAAVLLQQLAAERCETDDSEWTWQPVSQQLHDLMSHLKWMVIWPEITEEQLAVFEKARLSVKQLVDNVDAAERNWQAEANRRRAQLALGLSED